MPTGDLDEHKLRSALIANKRAMGYLDGQRDDLLDALGYDLVVTEDLMHQWNAGKHGPIQVRSVATNNWRRVNDIRWLDAFESLITFELDPTEAGARYWNISKARLVDVREAQ